MKKTTLITFVLVLLAVCSAYGQELYVGTYNVRYKNNDDTSAGNSWNVRRTYFMNFVNFQQPDLLGVQEALPAQMTDLRNGLTGYGSIGVGRNDGANSGEYSAIFYRKETMVLLDNGDFWLSDTPYKPSKGFPSKGGGTQYYRICSWGKFFHKASGTVVYHFNTHLDLDETNRQQSYYLIKQKIEEIASKNLPVIVSGDYNAVQTGDAYKLFSGSGFLYDCFSRTKQKFITNGTCPGFNAGNYSLVSGEFRRIDHIFVSRAFNVEHYAVLNPCYYSETGTATYQLRAYSDHSPVFAKLTLRTPEMTELTTTPPPMLNGVYQLSTPEELQAFSYIVNGVAGYTQNAAAKAVLLNDIDMQGMSSWRPIGSVNAPYTGTFDGQGYSIRNIQVKTGKGYSGLFGNTSGATIRDFRISGIVTVAEGSGEHGTVGYASSTTIQDVHSSLNITTGVANADTKHIGGIAGTLAASSRVSRCSYAGTLTDAGTNTVGGIAGYADQSANRINDVLNLGKITTKGNETNTGGILGYVNYAALRLSRCVNAGAITGNQTYSGQIVGRQIKAMTFAPSDLYYLDGKSLTAFGSGTDGTSAVGATAVTAEQLASGEICYLLNGDQTDINWYQTLPGWEDESGADACPVPMRDHLRVWRYDNLYSNDSPDGMEEMQNPAFKVRNSGGAYDIGGRKIDSSLFTLHSSLKRGLYILNGKKIVVK